MKLKIDKENILKKDIVIPKGYRLPKMRELLKEYETNKKIKNLLVTNWIWGILPNGEIGAVWCSDDGGGFHVYGYDHFDGSCRSRRVLVKIEGDVK